MHTDDEQLYLEYLHRTGKRFSWAGMGDWRKAGRPTHDAWAGTKLAAMVDDHMARQLPLEGV